MAVILFVVVMFVVGLAFPPKDPSENQIRSAAQRVVGVSLMIIIVVAVALAFAYIK